MRSVDVCASCDQVRSSGTRPTAITASGRRCPLLISTMTSVPPARTIDDGSAASAPSASARVVEISTLMNLRPYIW